MRLFIVIPVLFTAAVLLAGCAQRAIVGPNPGAKRLTAEMHPAVVPTSNRRHKLSARAGLRPEPLPQCALSKPPADIPANEAGIVMLDYERQCYKQIAEIDRAKLHALQNAVARNRARKVGKQKLLEPVPPAQCEFSKPSEGIPQSEARAIMLDYERQCYKHTAEIAHAKLDALQLAMANGRNRSVHKRKSEQRRYVIPELHTRHEGLRTLRGQ